MISYQNILNYLSFSLLQNTTTAVADVQTENRTGVNYSLLWFCFLTFSHCMDTGLYYSEQKPDILFHPFLKLLRRVMQLLPLKASIKDIMLDPAVQAAPAVTLDHHPVVNDDYLPCSCYCFARIHIIGHSTIQLYM